MNLVKMWRTKNRKEGRNTRNQGYAGNKRAALHCSGKTGGKGEKYKAEVER